MKSITKIILCLSLVALLVLAAGAGQARAAEGEYGYTLTELGTIEDSDGNIEIADGLPVVRLKTGYKALTTLGEAALEETYVRVSSLGDGYYQVIGTEEDVNDKGLITADGEELIPCEAAMISVPSYEGGSVPRFLEIVYATGETDSLEEAFFYVHDGFFSIQPSEDDTLYTGYAKVFDLQEKQFVEGIEITNSSPRALKVLGDTFFLEDEEGTTTLYNANGEALMQTDDYISDEGVGYYIMRESGVSTVYDENGEALFESEGYLHSLSGSRGFIGQSEGNGYIILDKNGNQVVDAVCETVYDDDGYSLRVKDGLGYKLIFADGTEVKTEQSPYEIDYGFRYSDSDSVYSIYYPDGRVVEGLEARGAYSLTIQNEEGSYFVINDEDFTFQPQGDYCSSLTIGMILDRNDDRMYGVIDLFTGEELLPYAYKAVEAADGYLYAYADGAWTVFELSGPVAA